MAAIAILFTMCGALSCSGRDPARRGDAGGWLVGDTHEKLDTLAKHLRGNDVVMLEVELRHRELLTAIEVRNWRYAEYQLAKMELAMQLGIERRPARKPSYEVFFASGLLPMKQALATRDARVATAAYDTLSAGCVTCHGMEKVEFMPVTFRANAGR